MSYSPNLSSAFNSTTMRTQKMAVSGMCSHCSADCTGTCEIGTSAMRGAMAVYPNSMGAFMVGSEKTMPIDYSHFNINGRVFGAMGVPATVEDANFYAVNLEQTIGIDNPIKMSIPVILPALLKPNLDDYLAGAAMMGIPAIIGESVLGKYPDDVVWENGKVVKYEKLKDLLECYRKYQKDAGVVILQCNGEDDAFGLPDYAIKEAGVTALEIKFGQSAKGTQAAIPVKDLATALAKKAAGDIILPDPTDEKVQEAYAKKACPPFIWYMKQHFWTEEYLVARVAELREMGLKNLFFKMAGYDVADMEKVLRIAAACKADMVTFDGAGGGSGFSPCKMMNEWGYPAILIEAALVPVCKKLEAEGLLLPAIAVTGGFATEDQVYKALALGAPYVKAVGLCRSTMAAAMTGKKIGELLEAGTVPNHVKAFGTTKEEVFAELGTLRWIYGEDADMFSTGAIGAYSYLKRIAFGLQHFATLNRKFDVKYIDQSDLIPLTKEAKDILNGTWF
ncbi:MAG: FMN-binding glutamate synthase family protein [Lachnospiraceae bacterium]|nr:FMN-binding glutamate synthase family protein [Lachnospiraceae bacterium]